MRPLKLFVGSGNLGNAEPDTSSIAAWIPEDGNCSEVLDHQKYPIVRRMEDFDTVKEGDDDESQSSHHEDPKSEANSSPPNNNDKSEDPERFDIIVLGMQESTFEPIHISEEMLDEIKGQLPVEENGALPEVLESEDGTVDGTENSEEEDELDDMDAMEQRVLADDSMDESAMEQHVVDDTMDESAIEQLSDKEEDASITRSEKEQKLSVRSVDTIGDDSVDTVGNDSTDSASGSLRASILITGSMVHMAKKAGKAGKVVKTAGKSAGKQTYKAAKKTGKVAMSSAQQVAKVSEKAAKTAAKKTGKAAVSSAQQVAKVGEAAGKQAEKAARRGVETVNMFTASREHKKDNGQLISDGTNELHQLIQERLPSYKRMLSFQRGEMRLLVYSLEKHHTVTIKSVRAQNTGMAGLANKGGIVAECVVGEGTVMSFMSCHLEAHEGTGKYATRCSTLGDILKGTKKYAIPSIYPDASLASHYCFVLGDLNFRTRHKGRIKSEEQLEDVTALVEAKDWKELNECDELRMALQNHECLHGFQTLLCNFMPTFKLERAEGYKYKAQRTPSYTDRILWRTGDKLERNIKPLAYEPIDNYATSDHKPIRGAFEIQLNRRVFLKKREPPCVRASVFPWGNNEDHSKHEHLHLFVCDIQCDIFPNSEWSSKPDSYVCLISSPEDILLKKPTKMKQITSVMKKFLKLEDVKEDSGEHKEPKNCHNDDWPRTGKIKNTHNPDWKNREIQCILKTHTEDGSPINLTGAMLHIFVFKHNGSQMDQVIGSYPINLENVYRSCTLLGSHSMRRSWRKSVERKSITSIREAHDNMVSMEIDGPLLKNGRQTGVLRCTIDAWWIIDTDAEALDPDQHNGDPDMDASDASHGLFSSRKRASKK